MHRQEATNQLVLGTMLVSKEWRLRDMLAIGTRELVVGCNARLARENQECVSN